MVNILKSATDILFSLPPFFVYYLFFNLINYGVCLNPRVHDIQIELQDSYSYNLTFTR